MDKVKRKVNLTILNCLSYAIPNAVEFKRKYPAYGHYNAAIYLNNHRVRGPKDFRHNWIFDTGRSGIVGIETVEILKALNIPEEIIKQIKFED